MALLSFVIFTLSFLSAILLLFL